MSIEQRPRPRVRELPPSIGKYEIKALLGEGATGAVFEGFDPDIERRVAIKTLHPHLLAGRVGAGLLARFKREAISAAKCAHPNIVAILEYGQQDDWPFIVMEYVDGISVQRLIKQRRAQGRGISLKRNLNIVSGLLAALHAAHGLGIVHRDVKASNVLITRDGGQIKLADFGMARLAESSDLTMIGSLIGSPRYMAPEVRFGLSADHRADVFSATRLFLELLKMLPDSTRCPRTQLAYIADMPPGNRIDYSVPYPSAFIPVLVRGLDPDRTRRYQSVGDLMKAIKRALPNLQLQQAPDFYARAVAVDRPAAAAAAASDEEVEALTSLLAVFTGPLAKVIVDKHNVGSITADNLAQEIAAKIPEREKQLEFLRRWQTMCSTRQSPIDAIDAIEARRPEIFPEAAHSRGDMLNRIGSKFAHYLEPITRTLSRKGKGNDGPGSA